MFRKMYDAAPADAGGAPPVEAPGETLSVAAQMAKSGRKLSGDEPSPQKADAPPPPLKTEVAPPAPPPSETDKPAPPATEPPKSEVKPEPAKPAPAEEPAKPDKAETWQEALKKQKPDAVLAELGYDAKQVKLLETIKADPKMAKFFDHWSSKGDVNAYLKAASTDYTKMSSEDVMRHSLRERNPEMSTEDFNELYAMKVIERYKLDPEQFTEAEIRRGRIELAADAKEHRDTLVKQQQDYFLSVAPDQAPPPVDDSAQKLETRRAELRDEYKAEIQKDPYIQGILSSKTLTVGEGEDAFKYAIPENFGEPLLNDRAWATKLYKSVPDENGEGKFIINPQKLALVNALLHDHDGFLNAHATHHQALGANKAVAHIENASIPGGTPSKADPVSTNPAERMAKSGRVIPGGQ